MSAQFDGGSSVFYEAQIKRIKHVLLSAVISLESVTRVLELWFFLICWSTQALWPGFLKVSFIFRHLRVDGETV